MRLSDQDLILLFTLMDEAIDLPEDQQEAWLSGLAVEITFLPSLLRSTRRRPDVGENVNATLRRACPPAHCP
jgi:hypothetical protein